MPLRLRGSIIFFQLRQNFRIAHVHPAALNFQSGEFLSGGNHRADGGGQFIFAARRFLQARREIENRRAKNVNARVIPRRRAGLEPAVTAQLFQLFRRGFFHKPFQAELFVEKIQAAFRHVLAARDGDDSGKIAFAKTPEHLWIRFRRDQNVAISQQKRRVADKILRDFRRFARAVLDKLPAKGNVRAEFLAVAEIIFNHVRAKTSDDENLFDPRRYDSGDDVFQNRFALHAEHRLGQLVGEFPHARAFAGGEDDGFHAKNLTTACHAEAMAKTGWTTIKIHYLNTFGLLANFLTGKCYDDCARRNCRARAQSDLKKIILATDETRIEQSMNGDSVSKLFQPVDFAPDSTEALNNFLVEYGRQRLIYPGNDGPNSGYIFRGEIKFNVRLQSSLERECFNINKGKTECSIDELLFFEKNLVETFMQNAGEIFNLSKKHGDLRLPLPHDENVFEWLQLKQHYQTKTRLLDFTRQIHFALYFALEHFYKKCNEKFQKDGLIIYCFPCIDIEKPKTGKDNKSPFKDISFVTQPDINLAIGGQIKLGCMEKHKQTFNVQYCFTKQKQSFGWDRAYNPNPRLSFQEGMLAYPYKTDGIQIKNSEPSWFIQCLQKNLDDPFNLGSVKQKLPAVMIRIPEKSVDCCRKYIEDIRGLTPAKVYLDFGRIGEGLQTLKNHDERSE